MHLFVQTPEKDTDEARIQGLLSTFSSKLGPGDKDEANWNLIVNRDEALTAYTVQTIFVSVLL